MGLVFPLPLPPVQIVRVILFLILAHLFPWLEWCDLWRLLNAILNVFYGAAVPVWVPPWNHGDDDDDADDDDDDDDYHHNEMKKFWYNLFVRKLLLGLYNCKRGSGINGLNELKGKCGDGYCASYLRKLVDATKSVLSPESTQKSIKVSHV